MIISFLLTATFFMLSNETPNIFSFPILSNCNYYDATLIFPKWIPFNDILFSLVLASIIVWLIIVYKFGLFAANFMIFYMIFFYLTLFHFLF